MSKRIRTGPAQSGRRPTRGRRRRLGQHFLTNARAARRIVAGLGPLQDQHVLEIGPGRGALTAPLIEAGARLTAVEVDPDLAQALLDRFAAAPGFRVVQSDILACDLRGLAGGDPLRVVANIPYSITGPILMHLFAAARGIRDMTLMMQKEVADRIVAAPGSRPYGSLSVLAQYFTLPRVVMTLGPGSFTPPPGVSSRVVAMPFRARRELDAAQEASFPRFVRALFASPRRTLRNNLRISGLIPDEEQEPASHRAGIDLSRRPETLSREEVLDLIRSWPGDADIMRGPRGSAVPPEP